MRRGFPLQNSLVPLAGGRRREKLRAMDKPVIATIEHHSTREEVLQKLRSRFGDIRAQIAPYASSFDEEWTESGVKARAVALGQAFESRIDVDERAVRVEVRLPALLGMFGGLIGKIIRREAPKLLR